ncbi:MAG: hypothetical protein AABX48_00675 [Nanoarchaeota archaeon]
MSGVADTSCGIIGFQLNPNYPFYLDPGTPSSSTINSGTYVKDYKDHWLIPYTLRVDNSALDGINNITVQYSSSQGIQSTDFPIEVKNLINEFDVKITDYSPDTKRLTLQILNVGKNDVDALTIEIPSQDTAVTYGTNYQIIGSLDVNDNDQVIFNADLKDGPIKVIIQYNDLNNVRRTYEPNINFDSKLFSRKVPSGQSNFSYMSFIYGILSVVVLYFAYRWYKKRKHNKEKPLRIH